MIRNSFRIFNHARKAKGYDRPRRVREAADAPSRPAQVLWEPAAGGSPPPPLHIYIYIVPIQYNPSKHIDYIYMVPYNIIRVNTQTRIGTGAEVEMHASEDEASAQPRRRAPVAAALSRALTAAASRSRSAHLRLRAASPTMARTALSKPLLMSDGA